LFNRVFFLFLSGSLIWSVIAVPTLAAAIDHSHQLFGQVLDQFVRGGLVDYAKLQADSKDLDRYLDELAPVPESEFEKWEQQKQLAFLINLYNAQTLKLVIEHYPVKSIKDIGNILKGPWDQRVVRLWGETVTLNTLEHEILRKDYDEPRIHFALVCAAHGCPPLRKEPYVAERLNSQLEDQGRAFFLDATKNRLNADEGVLYLSSIFKWFKSDFTKKGGSLQAFVEVYFPPEVSQALEREKFKVKFTRYDWSLNEVKSEF